MKAGKEKYRFIGNPFVMNGEDKCPKCGGPLMECLDKKKEKDNLWMCTLCTWIFQEVYEKKKMMNQTLKQRR